MSLPNGSGCFLALWSVGSLFLYSIASLFRYHEETDLLHSRYVSRGSVAVPITDIVCPYEERILYFGTAVGAMSITLEETQVA